MAKIKKSKALEKPAPDNLQLLMSLLRIFVARYVDGRSALVCRIRKSAGIIDVKLSVGDDSSILMPMTAKEVQQTFLGVGIREDFRETAEGEALHICTRPAKAGTSELTTDTLKRAVIAYSAEIVQGAGQYGRIDPFTDPHISLQLSSLKRCLQWLEQAPTASDEHGGKAALLAALQYCSRMTRDHLQQCLFQARATGHPSQSEVMELIGEGRMDRVHGRVMLDVAAGMEKELLMAQLQRSPLQMAATRAPPGPSTSSLPLASTPGGAAGARMGMGMAIGGLLSPQGRGSVAGSAPGAAASISYSPTLLVPMPQPGHGSAAHSGGLARPSVAHKVAHAGAHAGPAPSPHVLAPGAGSPSPHTFHVPSLQPLSPPQQAGSPHTGSLSPTQRHRHELIALANSYRAAGVEYDVGDKSVGRKSLPTATHAGRTPVPFPQQAELPHARRTQGTSSLLPASTTKGTATNSVGRSMKKHTHRKPMARAVGDKAAASPTARLEAERTARIQARTESVQHILEAAKEGKAGATAGTAFEEPLLAFRARPGGGGVQKGTRASLQAPLSVGQYEENVLDNLLKREEELMKQYAEEDTKIQTGVGPAPKAAVSVGQGYGKSGLRAAPVGSSRLGASPPQSKAPPSPTLMHGQQQAVEHSHSAAMPPGQYLTYGMGREVHRLLGRQGTEEETPKPILVNAGAQPRRAKYDITHSAGGYDGSIHTAGSLTSVDSYMHEERGSVAASSYDYTRGGSSRKGHATEGQAREYIYSPASSVPAVSSQVRLPSLIPGDDSDDRPWMRPLSGVTATSGSPSRQAAGGSGKPPGHRPAVPVVSWTTGARVDASPGQRKPVATIHPAMHATTFPLMAAGSFVGANEGGAVLADGAVGSPKVIFGAFSPVRSAVDAQAALHSANDMSREDIAEWARSLVSRSTGAVQASDQYVAALTAGTATKKGSSAALSPSDRALPPHSYLDSSRTVAHAQAHAQADDTGGEYVPDRSAIKALAMLQGQGEGGTARNLGVSGSTAAGLAMSGLHPSVGSTIRRGVMESAAQFGSAAAVGGVSRAIAPGHNKKGKAPSVVAMSNLSTRHVIGNNQASPMPPKPSADGQTVSFARRAAGKPVAQLAEVATGEAVDPFASADQI